MTFKLLRIFASALALAAGAASAAVNLPALNIDKTQTTVSGLSSGGFMAVQLHVAYSATFRKGAGVVAGGPFYCAEGSVLNATGRCMASPAGIPTSTLVSTTNSWAQQGLIDPSFDLAGADRRRHLRPVARHQLLLDREGGGRCGARRRGVGRGRRHHHRHGIDGDLLHGEQLRACHRGARHHLGLITTLKQTGVGYYVIGTCP